MHKLVGCTEPKWMVQHRLDGRPYDPRCPWCVQGKPRKKRAVRVLDGTHKELAGSTLSSDLTGPFEPGHDRCAP